MREEVKKGLFGSLGAVLLSKEKLEKATSKLVKESKLSREDAAKLKEELLQKGEIQWSELEGTLKGALHKGLQSLGLGSRSELDELKMRLNELERRVSVLEGSEQSGEES